MYGIVIRPLNYVEQNGYLKILVGCLWGKIGLRGGELPSNLSGHIKRVLELSIFVQMSRLLIL